MDCTGGYHSGVETMLDVRLSKKMKIGSEFSLEGHSLRFVDGRTVDDSKSPFESIPLEVLGNIFLEYYYDEEVQQNSGYFIGANWERWSRPGYAPSVANMVSSCDEGDAKTDTEQKLGHPGAVLGLVCRSWRKVYLSTPRLWSSIRIWLNLPYTFYNAQNLPLTRWNRRERDISAITRQIELHLRRSRAVPLSIQIQTNCFNAGAVSDLSAAGDLFGQVLDCFQGDLWRVRELVVKRTDHARTSMSPHKLPFSNPISSGGSGLATPPYSASPRSPCGFRNPIASDNDTLSALEKFITKLDRLRSLTLDNWAQDAVLNFTKPVNGTVLPSLRNLTLLSSSPTFCCSGIPWYQITKFTSYHNKYSYGQFLDLLGAMPLLTSLDVKMAYNEPGVTSSPYPSPQPSPLPSPSPTHTRHSGGFFAAAMERERSASPPRRRSHVHLPFLTHMSLQGLPKSIQLALCSLKAKQLTTLKLNSFEAGIGVPQVLSDQCACESLFRFLRRSQCNLESLRVDAMFLVPPQPSQHTDLDPKYIYSYILKPDFAPLQNLKTLIIGRGHPETVEKLLLTLAWKGDPKSSDLFPQLEEFGCEMKLGHMETNALAGLVMSRIPSGVVFASRPSEGCGLPDAMNARLWPILPQDVHHALHQQLKKYPTRLRIVHAPSAKANVNVVMRQYFRSWFSDFPHDSELFLPQLLY